MEELWRRSAVNDRLIKELQRQVAGPEPSPSPAPLHTCEPPYYSFLAAEIAEQKEMMNRQQEQLKEVSLALKTMESLQRRQVKPTGVCRNCGVGAGRRAPPHHQRNHNVDRGAVKPGPTWQQGPRLVHGTMDWQHRPKPPMAEPGAKYPHVGVQWHDSEPRPRRGRRRRSRRKGWERPGLDMSTQEPG